MYETCHSPPTSLSSRSKTKVTTNTSSFFLPLYVNSAACVSTATAITSPTDSLWSLTSRADVIVRSGPFTNSAYSSAPFSGLPEGRTKVKSGAP